MEPEKVNKIARYIRHIEINNFGEAGQFKVQKSRIAIVGAGGLGCPVVTYLAAAGVGAIKIIDADTIDISNLQRQFLYRPSDTGQLKAAVALEKMTDFNPDIQVEASNERLNVQNIDRMLSDFELIVDCSDNFETRYLLNRFAIENGKTLVSGAVSTTNGQLFTFKRGHPCYECLFPPLPENSQAPSCTEAPVLGSVVGTIGLMMVTEIMKEITGIGKSLAGSFISLSAADTSTKKIAFNKHPDCKICN
ncbi:MAG: adenylyltransferase [Micavibrio aeruginosavorus]|uniref:Adenylyltransferase n=1 Tax=Micavibrio aeruginosavorus TaxID=349221 RepID=A0A2W5FK95_9BACT|nr:MAG: adenylyltransferase [Micavibrio aeruginosavorus]